MSSLSHSMTWRSAIAAGSIGTSSSSRSWVSTKPPGCCDRCRGAPISCAGELERQPQPPVVQVEVELLGVLRLDAFLRPAPDLRRQHLDQVLGQAQRLADIAQRALGAIADHGRAERGVVAAVGLVDPLHDDLAPLVLEVDVDVRRLAALLGDEALEQQVVALRIDRGDAEHVADGGVGGRAAALAQDVLASGRSGRSSSPSGSRARSRSVSISRSSCSSFGTTLVGHALGIALGSAFPGQLLQRLLRREAGHRRAPPDTGRRVRRG